VYDDVPQVTVASRNTDDAIKRDNHVSKYNIIVSIVYITYGTLQESRSVNGDYETLDAIQCYIDGTDTSNCGYYSCVHCVDTYDLPDCHKSSVFADQFTITPAAGSVSTIRSSMIDTPFGGQRGSSYEAPVRSCTLYEDPGSERDRIYACLENKKIQTLSSSNVM